MYEQNIQYSITNSMDTLIKHLDNIPQMKMQHYLELNIFNMCDDICINRYFFQTNYSVQYYGKITDYRV